MSRYLECIIHHVTTTTPPCLNKPAGQLHLYVNTRLGSGSPHMATNNLQKRLEMSSKLCSSQFGQKCFMPFSYYSSADVCTNYVSPQKASVWSLRVPVEETRLMEQIRWMPRCFFYEERQRSAQFCAQNPVARGQAPAGNMDNLLRQFCDL